MQVKPFTYNANPAHILFGPGSRSALAQEVRRLGCRRAIVLSTPGQHATAEQLLRALGKLGAGVFTEAAMHTPVNVTEQALMVFAGINADCVLTVGGGSAIGLGKAIAYRNGAPQIAIPTTYAGSEVTPILGQTEHGLKTTLRQDSILPNVVIYDSELTLQLPVAVTVSSGLNAMAHAVEALYARDRNPITSLMALEGLRSLKAALPAIVHQPRNVDARNNALYGAWLCGTVLGTVGMALHHKLCHTLGGSFGLPHAETHAILLPHTASYNSEAAADVLAPAADMFDGNLAVGLQDFARSLGAPTALKTLGLAKSDLKRAASLAVQNPYWNPRPLDADALLALLERAWDGSRPQ